MKKLFVLMLAVAVAALCYAQDADKKAPAVEKTAKPAMEKPAMAPAAPMKEITVKAMPAVTAATMMVKGSDYAPKDGWKAVAFKDDPKSYGEAYTAMSREGFTAMGAWMKDAKVAPTGPCFEIFFENPEQVKSPGELTAKCCFPVAPDTKGTEKIKVETLPAQEDAVLEYDGPYEGSDAAWGRIMGWVKEKGYEMAGAPSEVYLKGPADTKNPAEFVTEIHMPVKKAEVKHEGGMKMDVKKDEAPKVEKKDVPAGK